MTIFARLGLCRITATPLVSRGGRSLFGGIRLLELDDSWSSSISVPKLVFVFIVSFTLVVVMAAVVVAVAVDITAELALSMVETPILVVIVLTDACAASASRPQVSRTLTPRQGWLTEIDSRMRMMVVMPSMDIITSIDLHEFGEIHRARWVVGFPVWIVMLCTEQWRQKKKRASVQEN